MLLGLLAAASAAPVAAQTAPTIRVAAIPIDVSAAVYYAQDLGLFKKAGLTVEIQSMGSGAAIAPAVASGAVDVGSSNFISLAQGHEHHIPFLMIAPSGVYSSASPTTQLIVLNSSPIKTAKDLNGKIVGVASLNNIASITVSAWSDKNGGDYKSLKFVEVPFAQMTSALSAGRVDAIEVAEPFLTQALQSDGRQLAHDGDAVGSEWVEGGYFASADYVRANTDALKKFAAAIADAGRWANANPDDAALILEKYSKRPPVKTLFHAAFPAKFKPADAQPMIDAAAKYGAIKASFPSADMMATEVTGT
jgi:NitT/TauT family transport system substrate-binding protein